jgi:hypothetical protein
MGAEQSDEHEDRHVDNALQELLAASGIGQPEQLFVNRGPIVVERTTPKVHQSALDLIDARRADGKSA